MQPDAMQVSKVRPKQEVGRKKEVWGEAQHHSLKPVIFFFKWDLSFFLGFCSVLFFC